MAYLSSLELENEMYKRPNKLSGGQQQRVAIARALMNDPKIILADEPTGNLDSKSGAVVMDILKNLNKKGKTVIIITHEEDIAKQTKRTIKLADGELI
ncbi:MAG: lipoprotein-releasing system ATP-binding protein LolD, partial [Candidatus Levybacteria bacterium CG_4_10_14_0_2_um_filter_35_8]